MMTYVWSGRDANSRSVSGTFEALTPGHVADWLHGTGVTPLVIEPERKVDDASEMLARWLGRQRVDLIELMLFSRQMVTLMRAGIPIMRALRALELSSARPALKRLMRELNASLDAGLDLSQALAKRPDVFDPFYVAMVKVGETTGRLEEIFQNLFHHLEFQKFMRDQVKTALRYPSFVVLAMVAALVAINIVVIPAFAKVFANLHAELPLMTRILLGSSRFMLNAWPVLLLGAVAATMAARAFVATESGRLAWDRFKLRLPIVGTLVRKGVLAQAARSLALVFRSGVPIVNGLTLSAQVVENAVVANALRDMRTGVEHGETLLSTSQRTGIFTPVVQQMIAVGEESGQLGEMLDEIGRMYQAEVEYELKTLSSKVEPLLMVLLGGMVLVLALGVFLPMWELGSHAVK